MRSLLCVAGSFFGLALTCTLSAQVPAFVDPSYIKLEPGTLAVGGVDDLIDGDEPLVLMPTACRNEVAVTQVGVGFVMTEALPLLDVHLTVDAAQGCRAEVLFRNWHTGRCDTHASFALSEQRTVVDKLAVDSGTYGNRPTAEVELCLVIQCYCGPSTDKDAVAVHEVSIGPTPQ